MKADIKTEEYQATEFILFDKTDSKNRLIGARINTCEVVTIEHDETTKGYYYNLEPNTRYYALNVHATRDNIGFGAIQSTRYFKSKAERSAAVEKYLTGARKRALVCRT